MNKIELTKTERLILANQNKILAFLDKTNADSYNNNVEIAECGYEGLYHQLFGVIGDNNIISIAVYKETDEILSLFRLIKNSFEKLSKEEQEKINLSAIEFEGFDANNDDHYHIATFMVEKLGLYKEFKGMELNSHTASSFENYRKLLSYYKDVKTDYPFSFSYEQLKEMAELA